jgi:hypothetical protein
MEDFAVGDILVATNHHDGRNMQNKRFMEVERVSPAGLRRPAQSISNSKRRCGVEENGFVFETFTLPLDAARRQVRDVLNGVKSSRYLETIEGWRQLPDGKIEFTKRRWPAPVEND